MRFLSSKLLSLIVASFLSMFVAANSQAATPLTDAEFDKRVRSYILSHPEVITEAILMAKEQEEKIELNRKKQIIADNYDSIYNSKNSVAVGPKDASVTIVEFFDYNCGACKMMFNGFEVLLLQDDDVRVIFKEFPIFGEQSETLAKIAISVNRLYGKDKYYDFHSKLMKFQGRMNVPMAYTIASNLGMKVVDLEKEVAKDELSTIIEEDRKIAQALGATGTPTLILGDEFIPHALDISGLKQRIAKIRSAK